MLARGRPWDSRGLDVVFPYLTDSQRVRVREWQKERHPPVDGDWSELCRFVCLLLEGKV